MLRTAAWFHDLGYVENAVYHELISARIAVEVLPYFGYRKEEVEFVRWAILATALPQSPRNRLEEILADADLDILGTTDLCNAMEICGGNSPIWARSLPMRSGIPDN